MQESRRERLHARGIRVVWGDLHLQMSRVEQCRVKCRYRLVVKLKANKCYQKLLCYLSSYINLLNIKLCGWLQAPGRFQTFSPWSRTHIGSRPLAVLALVLVFGQSFLGKVCCDLIALRWVACFVAIRPHLVFGGLIVLNLSFGLSLNWLFLTLFVRDFGPLHNCSQLSSALPSSCLSSLPSNCARLCVIVLDCSWLCRAVVCRFCQTIVCNFGWLVGWSVLWPCLCKLFLTIGSLNYERSKTKSIYK